MLITRPTLDDYLDNLLDILIGSGIAFQLPLISYVLTHIGSDHTPFSQNLSEIRLCGHSFCSGCHYTIPRLDEPDHCGTSR